MTNNWNNPKCRPEIIFTEFNRYDEISGQPDPKKILGENNYTMVQQKIGFNNVYIANQVFEKYSQIKAKNEIILA